MSGSGAVEVADATDGGSVYENTNGMPMANGRNLHMEVGARLADNTRCMTINFL
jgi:hypothetical protein